MRKPTTKVINDNISDPNSVELGKNVLPIAVA
jgi:hypothetical protein